MKTANTVFGRSSGKLAGVVASSWKGLNVVREKPLTVANPNTIGQQNQRAKMRFLVASGRSLLSLLQLSMKEAAIKQSEFNAFTSLNMQALTAAGGAVSVVTAANIKVGKGTLLPVPFVSATATQVDVVDAEWTNNSSGASAQDSDVIYGVLYAYASKKFYVSTKTSTRAATAATFGFPDGDAIANASTFYLVAVRASEGKASDSTNMAL